MGTSNPLFGNVLLKPLEEVDVPKRGILLEDLLTLIDKL